MKLTRITLPSAVSPTLGHLTTDEDQVIVCTLERHWTNNAKGDSCIPATMIGGVRMHAPYVATRWQSPHFGCEVWEITGVPGREKILIHWGNFTTDSNGCVLVGKSFADLNHDGFTDVASSKEAFRKWMTVTASLDSFEIDVIDPDPVQAVAA